MSEHYGQDDGDDYAEEEAAKEDEVLQAALHGLCVLLFCSLSLSLSLNFLIQVIVPHGEPVTLETFVAWRERYEAELALERAK